MADELNQNSITQTVMGGWRTEKTSEIQDKESVREIENMRITSRGDGSYLAESIDGNKISFRVTENYEPIGFVSIQDKLIVYSTNCKDLDGGFGEIGVVTFDQIAQSGPYIPIYCDKGLLMSTYYQIRGIGIREHPRLERATWWDNHTSPKSINVTRFFDYATTGFLVTGNLELTKKYMVLGTDIVHDGITYGPNQTDNVFTATLTTFTGTGIVIPYESIELLSISPNVVFNQPRFKEVINGELTSGTYYYVYKLCDVDGNGTQWSIPSQPIILSSKKIKTAPNIRFGGYQDYTGSANDIITDKGIRVAIDNLDLNFTHLQVAYVKAVDDLEYTSPKVFYFDKIIGSSINIDHISNDGNINEFGLEELVANLVVILRNRDGAAIKNQLVLGDYETPLDPEFDLSSVTATSIRRRLPADYTLFAFGEHKKLATILHGTYAHNDLYMGMNIDSQGVAESGDMTTLPVAFENLLWGAPNYYKVEGGTIEVNGPLTIAVTYNDGDTFVITSELTWKKISGNPKVFPLIWINKYGNVGPGGGELFTEKIHTDFFDYKGIAVNHYYKSLWRSETYRYAITLFKRGIPMYSQHLKDYKVPDIKDEPLIFMDASERHYTNTLGVAFSGLDFNKIVDSLKVIENDPSIGLADLPKYFDSWAITRAKRDEQILAEGLLFPVMNSGTGSGLRFPDCLFAQGPASTYADYWHRRYGRAKDLFVMFSPDQLFEGARVQHTFEDNDYVELKSYMGISSPDVDAFTSAFSTQGNQHTPADHWYQKYFIEDFSAASLTSVGDKNPILKKYCKHLSIYEEFAGIGGKTFKNSTGIDTTYFQPGQFSDLSLFPSEALEAKNNPLTLIHGTRDNDFPGHGWAITSDVFPASRFTDLHKPYVAYTRNKSILYGGNSASAKANTIYYMCGHYQQLDSNFMTYLLTKNGIVDNIEIFGGDTFVNIFDYARCVGDSAQYKHDYGENEDSRWHSQTIIFPVQSKINTLLREGRRVAEKLCFNINVPGENIGPTVNPDGVCVAVASSPEQKEQLVYNFGYSNNIMLKYPFVARPLNYRANQQREKTLIVSNKKTDGEVVDNWRKFVQGNELTLDNTLGPISGVRSKNDKLFVWQFEGISYIPVEERVSLTNSLGLATTIAAQSSIDRFDAINSNRGCQHTHGIAEYPEGFIFFDARKRDLCLLSLNGEVVSLAVIKDNLSYFRDNFFGDYQAHDNPINGKGIAAVYDDNFKHVLLSFRGLRDRLGKIIPDCTIVYDVLNNQFDHKGTYVSGLWFSHQNLLLATRPLQDPILPYGDYPQWKLLSQKYGDTYITLVPVELAANVPNMAGNPKYKLVAEQRGVYVHNSGPICRFFGVVEQSKIGLVVHPALAMSLYFENMKLDVGGSQFFFSSVLYKNSWQIITETVNRNYKNIDRMWELSVPLDQKKRVLNDQYLYVEFIKDNTLVGDKTISSNQRTKLLALTTYFKRAY